MRDQNLADISIRTVSVADAPSIVSLGRAIDRDQLATDATFRALLERETEPTTERLVAEAGGRVVAWAPSGMYASSHGWFWIGVDVSQRRRGLGGRLLERIEARLRACGAAHIETTPNDEDGRRFLLARGFEVANVVRRAELDPRRVVTRAPAATGVRVTSLGDVLDRAEAMFRLYAEARADIPSKNGRPPWTFDEWRAETIDSPLIDYDASVVLFEDDEPVALSWLYADRLGQRAEALMSATRRDRRGRGLATHAKVESARRAARLGITRITTSNDLDNAPMIAVNRKLGFTETAVVESFVKQFQPRESVS